MQKFSTSRTPQSSTVFEWWQLPSDHWFLPVREEMTADCLKEIPWPINEATVRRMARRQGMLVQRLSADRYRLWDLRTPKGSSTNDPFPVDLTACSEFVDSLAGIAYFVWLESLPCPFDLLLNNKDC